MPRTTQMLLQIEHYIDILILTLPQLLWSPQAVHLQILRRISGSTRSRLYAANHSQILRHNACGAEGQSRRRHERKHQIQENECVNHEGVGHRTPPPSCEWNHTVADALLSAKHLWIPKRKRKYGLIKIVCGQCENNVIMVLWMLIQRIALYDLILQTSLCLWCCWVIFPLFDVILFVNFSHFWFFYSDKPVLICFFFFISQFYTFYLKPSSAFHSTTIFNIYIVLSFFWHFFQPLSVSCHFFHSMFIIVS